LNQATNYFFLAFVLNPVHLEAKKGPTFAKAGPFTFL